LHGQEDDKNQKTKSHFVHLILKLLNYQQVFELTQRKSKLKQQQNIHLKIAFSNDYIDDLLVLSQAGSISSHFSYFKAQ